MSLAPGTISYLSARAGFGHRWMLWVVPRTLDTGTDAPFGVWNDVYPRDFTVNGVSRTYEGAYGVFNPPTIIEYEVGLAVQEIQINFNHLDPRIEDLLRTHTLRNAPMELHQAYFDADGALLEVVERFRGRVSRYPTVEPETNGLRSGTLHCVSSARLGTLTLGTLKSDESQRARSATDDFRRYASVTPQSADYWGKKG